MGRFTADTWRKRQPPERKPSASRCGQAHGGDWTCSGFAFRRLRDVRRAATIKIVFGIYEMALP